MTITNITTEAERLLAGITLGPWQSFHDNEAGDDRQHYIGRLGDGFLDRAIATYLTESDAAFIAASRDLVPRLVAACRDQMVEIERLRKIVAGCDWYWPEDDTSSDACADGPWQIAENIDAKPGEVFSYARGGVLEVRYFGSLPAADDSDSDDEFEVDEPTREAAEAKISAELLRRSALQPAGKDTP